MKQYLHHMLQSTRDFDADAIKNVGFVVYLFLFTCCCFCLQLAPTLSPPLLSAIKEVKNPHKTCRTIQENLRTLVMSFEEIASKNPECKYPGHTLNEYY